MKDKNLKILVKEIKKEFGVSLKGTPLGDVDDPSPILRRMINTSMNWHNPKYDCWLIGKKLQRIYPNKILFKTEYEVSAGLWQLIYEGKV